MWLCILQSRNSAQSVNPGTLCDGGVLRAQHSPRQDRLLFSPVMSILLGISASLHTTCCAQQRGEAGAGRAVVSACQSQSQGSVNSHHSEKLRPDVTCLQTPHSFFSSGCCIIFYRSCVRLLLNKWRQCGLFCFPFCCATVWKYTEKYVHHLIITTHA